MIKIMYTTHFLNYGVFDALLNRLAHRTNRCPFCRQQLPACDCGYGEIGLDQRPDRKQPLPKI